MIYILSLYGEDGAESVKATTDLEKVVDMLKSYRLDVINEHLNPDETYEIEDDEIESLQKLLSENKPVDGKNLVRGWGGFMLHVVEDFDEPTSKP